MTTIAPLTFEQLTAVAVNAIIVKAALLSRDPELNAADLFRQASAVIGEMKLEDSEREAAIRTLTEAVGL